MQKATKPARLAVCTYLRLSFGYALGMEAPEDEHDLVMMAAYSGRSDAASRAEEVPGHASSADES